MAEEKNTILEVRNLTKMFGKRKSAARELLAKGKSKAEILNETGVTVAVHDASFSVEEGKIHVLIGLSGSGKSTVIRCLNMLQPPTSGSIHYRDENIQDYDDKALREFRREKMSMVFQSFGLMTHRDVLSNVAYGLEVRKYGKAIREEKAMEMINMVGLTGWEHHSINSLSGGMRQRVGIARALTNDPDILLMDEPFSALDPLVRREMQFELLQIQEKLNKTIIFITHDIDEAFKLGNMVSIMRDGVIIQTATPPEMSMEPTDDYVKEFIESADKSQVYSVESVMQKPLCLIRFNTSVENAINQMSKNGVSSAYVLKDNLRLGGILTLDEAIRVRRGELAMADAIHTDVLTTSVDTQISDLIPLASEARYPIAVVDDEYRLKGIVSKASVLASLK